MTFNPERHPILVATLTTFILATILIVFYLSTTTTTTATANLLLACPRTTATITTARGSDHRSAAELDETILHYATSKITPQQTGAEIRVSLDVLRRRRPCNFLVFGLGHDSRMWSAFNRGGTTLFLEEDPEWVKSVLRGAPELRAETVVYRTQLKEADRLMATYRQEESCLPAKAYVKGNRRCKLALADLPAVVYEREWDLIMIDAPRGYFPEAPGRMAAIWTAAIMARNRKGDGSTDIFLHDVERKVEKEFANEFLCQKHRVGGTGRIWHFRVPAVGNGSVAKSNNFC